MTENVFGIIALEIAPNVQISQMFGKPCAKLEGGKPFLSYHENCMVFKIGAERVGEVLADNPDASPFDPSGKGRRFKDWIQVPEGTQSDWVALGREALDLYG